MGYSRDEMLIVGGFDGVKLIGTCKLVSKVYKIEDNDCYSDNTRFLIPS